MKKIILMAVTLLCLLACRRPANTSYQPLNPKVDEFLSFDTGSYWIYKDSISGDVDSMAVIKFDNYITTAAAENKYQMKLIRIGQFKSGESTFVFRWGYRTWWTSTHYDWDAYLDSLNSEVYYQVFLAGSLLNINAIEDVSNFIGNYVIESSSFDSVYKFTTTTLEGDTVIYHVRKKIGPLSIEYWQGGACKFNYKIINYHVNSVP